MHPSASGWVRIETPDQGRIDRCRVIPSKCACGAIQYSDIPADVGRLKCELCGVVLYDLAFALRSAALPQRLPTSEESSEASQSYNPERSIPVVIATPLILPDVQWRIERTEEYDVRSGECHLRYSLCCDGEELIFWHDVDLALFHAGPAARVWATNRP